MGLALRCEEPWEASGQRASGDGRSTEAQHGHNADRVVEGMLREMQVGAGVELSLSLSDERLA